MLNIPIYYIYVKDTKSGDVEGGSEIISFNIFICFR